jgi:NAD-dependent deacetylase
MNKKRLVVLSGAGMSAESGIPTFRGSDGLWEGFSIEEVASPQGWNRNRKVVLDFYNQRRKGIMAAKPNRGHEILAEMQSVLDVQIVTQNIDDLHERAGSKNVLHLHGEIMKARSTFNSNLIYDLKHWEIKEGDLCEKGSQLRPHIVWFGETVPMMDEAIDLVASADILVIVGTSMVVYPAASLVHYARENAPVFCVDPNIPPLPKRKVPIVSIQKGGSQGLHELKKSIAHLSQ